MSYGSHESSQYAEVIARGDGHEVTFQITLTCVSRGDPGRFSGPPEDCYPSEAAEFELESVHVLDAESKPHLISKDILKAVVGVEMAQQMVEDAETEAIESGDF